MHFLLCCLYLSLGASWMTPHPSPQSYGYQYWRFDLTQVENPYGIAEIGWDRPLLPGLDLELAARHVSSLGVDFRYGLNHQWGQNTAEFRLRWYPWRGE